MTTETGFEKRLGTALFYGVVALLAYLVYLIFEPFLVPLCWAAVLVVCFYPVFGKLRRRWGKTRAAAACTLGVTILLIVPALLLMIEFVRQGINAAGAVQQILSSGHFERINRYWGWVAAHAPAGSTENLAAIGKQDAERVASALATELGTVLRNVARFLFDLVVTLLAMFYLFRDGDSVLRILRSVLPFEEEHRDRVLGEARDLIHASVISSLAAAAVHGIVGGAAFALVGIGAAVFWGVVMAFCSLLPIVGSGIVWVPAAVILILQGRWGAGIFVLVLCGGVVALTDSIVRPWLISGRAKLSGLLVFVSVLGGIVVFGVLGVVLGPIVVATAASILDIYSQQERTSLPRHIPGKPAGK
ncbi:MAG: AI-2E family transporter [Candidatus Acidiferrales bacterium]